MASFLFIITVVFEGVFSSESVANWIIWGLSPVPKFDVQLLQSTIFLSLVFVKYSVH